MIWNHEKTTPYLEFPIKIERDLNLRVSDMDLNDGTIWHIQKSLNKWGNLTINDICDYLEKGIKYIPGGENYTSYENTLKAAYTVGLIPEISIGTVLTDIRFKGLPVDYIEDLPRLIRVWEKYNRHLDLVEVAKEIIKSEGSK
jgi:hypothetical protein